MKDSVWHEKLGLLEAKVSWLEAELNELKGVKPQEPERWRPRAGWLASLKELKDGHSSVVDREAVQYLLIKELANEFNDGWVPDWSDGGQKKYGIYFEHYYEEWRGIDNHTLEDCSWYTKTISDAEKALEILNRGDIDLLVKEVCGE